MIKLRKNLFSRKNQLRGFTLLEMIVALGVFIILFTLTLGIYAYSLRAERRALQMSKLQREAQLIMELVAKKIRSSRIDYNYYSGYVDTVNGEDYLALLDSSNEATIFRASTVNGLEVCITDCGDFASPNDDNFNPIPSAETDIENLVFFIEPESSPFSIDAPPSEFPRVTLAMDLVNNYGGERYLIHLQQTIPQRLAGP